jgi:hypothetical protein
MKAFARTAEIDALVDAYTASLAAAGLSSGYPNDSVARSFFVRVGTRPGSRCRWRSSSRCRRNTAES